MLEDTPCLPTLEVKLIAEELRQFPDSFITTWKIYHIISPLKA